jgi:NitT/TauT family transport system ATP-binding protein
MAGLDSATEGRVVVSAAGGGHELPSATVFQEASLFPWMRVGQNVAFAFDSLDVGREDVRRRVGDVLGLVGLSDYERAWPHELSGGMKQRAAVARAFVTDPPVLYMDEPFGALDELTRVGLANELMRLWERSPKTIVFVTHGIEEAVTLADRVVVLSARPGTVKEIVPIDFPRPRDAVTMRGDPAFGAHVVQLWELLR